MNRWLSPVFALVGACLLALGIWLDFRDGSPTMQRGDQPLEVVVTAGIGLALLISGLIGTWRAFTGRRARERDSGSED